MDTDEELPLPDQDSVFFAIDFAGGDVAENEASAELHLQNIVDSYRSAAGTRHHMADATYIEALQGQIYKSLDQRVGLVRQWAIVNTERFPTGNQDIRNVIGKINGAALAMRTAARLCSSGCSECQLLCLRIHRHTGKHDCGTDHRCVFDCSVSEKHSEREGCGMP
jgi:hypothetical protein